MVTIVEFLEVLETEVTKKNIFEQIAHIMLLNTAALIKIFLTIPTSQQHISRISCSWRKELLTLNKSFYLK